jgi:hypothetical protein
VVLKFPPTIQKVLATPVPDAIIVELLHSDLPRPIAQSVEEPEIILYGQEA